MAQPILAPSKNGPIPLNPARIRDYWLGGGNNTKRDRELGDLIVTCAPHLPYMVRTHRTFLQRTVRHLVNSGVRQFLDLGSGLPTGGNVHETAQAVAADCRVVYVDDDRSIVAESRALLAGRANVGVVEGDIRRPHQILASAEVRSLLDLDQPVAVLMIDILHHIPDEDDPASIIATYRDAICSGSYLAVSHICQDLIMLAAIPMYGHLFHLAQPKLTFRTPTTIAQWCVGLDLVTPGIVTIPLWRPEPGQDMGRYPEKLQVYGAVARKP
ncbi:MAG: SAM-dependent methyltransferase [Kutzneria sp.]|nr:SAM-dependent methyltransferase [Kutzneria sp.]